MQPVVSNRIGLLFFNLYFYIFIQSRHCVGIPGGQKPPLFVEYDKTLRMSVTTEIK